MIFAPIKNGNRELSRQELAEDKKNCVKIGPVGLGEKALYTNSFYIRRYYYTCWSDIRRVFKRVAMSKGGFSGKGIFATIPYLVIQKSDGTEQQCNFKIEQEVDEVLARIQKTHPEIPIYSAESEHKLRKAKAEQEAKYLKKLPENANASIKRLEDAKDTLNGDDRYSRLIVFAAKEKRSVDGAKPSLKAIAAFIDIASLAGIAAGLYIRFAKANSMGLYLALFGAAFILSVSASQILPTPRRNKKTVQKDWEEALSQMREFLKDPDAFPVPVQYAHPVVLDRMIRVIREGRASDEKEALEVVKKDLKALNNTVKVSQQEYDEVVTVKPLFLVCNYQ
ncbi:MAG: ATPase P [Eubacterium sp.]|nr:ATPase P [Eubacterium sp.]